MSYYINYSGPLFCPLPITYSDQLAVGPSTCSNCTDCLVRTVHRNYKVSLQNNQSKSLKYRVSSINRWLVGISSLDGCINWKVLHDNSGNEWLYPHDSHTLSVEFDDDFNGDLFYIFAYIVKPLQDVSAYTWIKKSYRRLIGRAIDQGNTTISCVFQYMCRFYVERYLSYESYDNWDGDDSADDMLEALCDFLLTSARELDGKDLDRRQKIVDHYDVTGFKSGRAAEFDDQWDKMKHFFKGVEISDFWGNWAGYEAGFLNEKFDSLTRVWGTIWGTRQPHHVGFDWKDFAWTAAGSLFHELFVDTPKDAQCVNLIHAVDRGELNLANLFDASAIPAGHGFFNQRWSPGFNTNIDLVDAALKEMQIKIKSHY